MAKGQFVSDTFERLSELGTSTVKKTGKAVAQTFTPTELLGLNSNHTPLDLEKLNKKYEDQDKKKEVELKQKLFQYVKEEEKKSYEGRKKKEEDRKQMFIQEDQEKKKSEEEKIRQEQQAEAPRGKKRRSIFSPKKTAERQHAEFKPATGKQ